MHNQCFYKKVLKNLQKAHLLNVPFENLDVHNSIPIILDIENIYQKVVLQNRGGFCYELNGLFYELSYGSKIVEIPFAIHLRDFQLERYPGTNNPSSFASEVTLLDQKLVRILITEFL